MMQTVSGFASGVSGAQLELAGIRKQFGPVRAVSDVSLTVRPGTVHGLVGENGAGKSTVGKIIAGVHRRDGGQMLLDGSSVDFASPLEALRHRVAMVSQELALLPHRSVLDNVLLGDEPNRRGVCKIKEALERYQEASEGSGFDLDPDVMVGTLRKSDQQKVEILRAISRGAQIIVMDEPTAALGESDSAALLETIRVLARQGRSVIFVSHFLNEVLSVCDDITIMRDGVLVRSGPAAEETPQSLVAGMVGQSMDVELPKRSAVSADAPVRLRVRGLSSPNGVRNVSLEIRSGEILGVAGLIGSGRSELARAIFGADRHDGAIELDGEAVALTSTTRAIQHGVVMLPESRKEFGLMLGRSIVENVSLPYLSDISRWGVVSRRREGREVKAILDELGVRRATDESPVGALSGGNQQKAMFSKWFLRQPRVLIADEPTQGVDVAAKVAIYRVITELAQEGLAVLLISSELEEVLGLAHRTIVMREGSIVGEFMNDQGDAIEVLSSALGASRDMITTERIV